jgi:hypothetical protein
MFLPAGPAGMLGFAEIEIYGLVELVRGEIDHDAPPGCVMITVKPISATK